MTEVKCTNYNDFVNEIQYTGAIYDKFSGLTYLNARFYDAATGRFITQDSYRGERNDADTWHLYLYCANDPINYVDPSGHFIVRRWMISVPTDILCVTFGWGLGMLSNVKEIKRVLSFTGKVIKYKTNKINPVLKIYRKIIKKYNKLMDAAGVQVVKKLAKRYLGVEIKKLKNGASKFASLITNFAKDFIKDKTIGELMKKIYTYSDIFSSVGKFVAGTWNLGNDKEYNNDLWEI